MNRKIISGIMLVTLFVVNLAFANCGGDHTEKKPTSDAGAKKSKVNTLVTTVANDGNINGLVITSCGQCNLGLTGKPGCSLTVKIGESIYLVEGTGIHDHGDAHGKEGFCSAVRIAWATGKIKDKIFHAESFELVGNSE